MSCSSRNAQRFRRSTTPAWGGFAQYGIWSTWASRTPGCSTYWSNTFNEITPRAVLEGIGRALAVPESRRFWRTLLRLFRESSGWRRTSRAVKRSIGCALSASVTEDVIDDVVALIGEPRHGENRIVFLKVLMESPSLKAQAAFEQAARDSQLMKEARFLKRLRDRRVRKPKMR